MRYVLLGISIGNGKVIPEGRLPNSDEYQDYHIVKKHGYFSVKNDDIIDEGEQSKLLHQLK